MDMIESPVQDLWRIFRVMAEFTEGFEELASIGPAVSFFGSSRAKPSERYYKLAQETASEVTKAGFAVFRDGDAGVTGCDTFNDRVVGLADVLQQTPRAVTDAPPLEVTLPPLEAVLEVIDDTAVVVTVVVDSVVKVRSDPYVVPPALTALTR